MAVTAATNEYRERLVVAPELAALLVLDHLTPEAALRTIRRWGVQLAERLAPGLERSLLAAPTSEAPIALPLSLEFPRDSVQQAVVEGFCWADKWMGREASRYEWRARKERVVVELSSAAAEAPELFLREHPEIAIKLQFALWGHYYGQVSASGQGFARVPLTQLCVDLGFQPHEGKPRAEHLSRVKQLAAELGALRISLDSAESSVEMEYRLWIMELRRHNQEASPDREPRRDASTLLFRPGPWFSAGVNHSVARRTGYISRTFLELRTHTDQSAIRLGACLAAHFGVSKRSTAGITLRVSDLARITGYSAVYEKRPRQLREKLRSGLQKLEEFGVIAYFDIVENDGAAQSVRIEWPICLPPLS